MSFEAMAWAVQQKLPSTKKIVLLMLANRTNSDTGKCIPKIKTLADDCGLSESSAKAAIKELAELGLLTIIPRFHEGQQMPNQYHLHFDGVGQELTPLGQQVAPVGQELATESGNEPVNEPVKKIKKKSSVAAEQIAKPEGVSDATWSDFLLVRKAKRAPLTDTALATLMSEAGKAGIPLEDALQVCCAQGWQGFKADWLRGKTSTRQSPRHIEQDFTKKDYGQVRTL